MWLGNSGVTFFFILSGFVLTWSSRPEVTRTTFWWRRFARIWPAHFVALLVAIPVFYSFAPDPAQDWVKPVSLGVLLLSLPLLQGWSRDPVVLFSGNPAAWTLTCEAFFYFLHPFIQRILGTLGRTGALVVAVGVVLGTFAYRIALLAWPASPLGDVPWPALRVTEFIIGMAIAWALRTGWRFRVPLIAWYVAGGLALLGIGVAPAVAHEHWFAGLLTQFNSEVTIALFAITLAVMASHELNGGRSVLRSRVMVSLGDMSYAFYLVHATLIYAVLAVFGPQGAGWSNLGWWAALTAASVGTAAMLHYGVERPIERRLRRWWDGRGRDRIADKILVAEGG